VKFIGNGAISPPTEEFIKNIKGEYEAPSILSNLCQIYMINKMIGYNIFTSAHQICQMVALMEDSKLEQEILNFCRGGSVYIPLNSIVLVLESKEIYTGWGLAPIQCYTEEQLTGQFN